MRRAIDKLTWDPTDNTVPSRIVIAAASMVTQPLAKEALFAKLPMKLIHPTMKEENGAQEVDAS